MTEGLSRHWERVLEAEGLGLGDPWSLRATPEQVDRCTEPFTGASGPDWEEQQRLRVVVSWLPECDRVALRWAMEGMPQQDLGDRLGVARSTAALRIAEAVRHARMLDAGPLPPSRDEYKRLLKGFWVGRQSLYRGTVVLAYFGALLDVWSPTAAARLQGLPPSTAKRWTAEVLATDVPRLAAVRHVLDVMRRARHRVQGSAV